MILLLSNACRVFILSYACQVFMFVVAIKTASDFCF